MVGELGTDRGKTGYFFWLGGGKYRKADQVRTVRGGGLAQTGAKLGKNCPGRGGIGTDRNEQGRKQALFRGKKIEKTRPSC